MIEILITNSLPVGGFQIAFSGVNINSASGGLAGDNGFTTSNSDDTILGFSLTGSTIPSGSGILTNLSGSLDYDMLKKKLPKYVYPAYDGMKLIVN